MAFFLHEILVSGVLTSLSLVSCCYLAWLGDCSQYFNLDRRRLSRWDLAKHFINHESYPHPQLIYDQHFTTGLINYANNYSTKNLSAPPPLKVNVQIGLPGLTVHLTNGRERVYFL